MASFPPEEFAAEELHDLLTRKHGLQHLRVRRRGKVLTIESGPKDDAHAHARLRRDTKHLYELEMPARRGRWEPTPVRDTVEGIVTFLVDSVPWTLAALDEDPDGTSDPGY